MRALAFVSTWLLLCGIAVADIALVQVNKENSQARLGNAVKISITEKEGPLEFRVSVTIPRGGKFLGASLELIEEGKIVAFLPLESKPNEQFNRGPQSATGVTITFRMTPELAKRGYLIVGLDHHPNVGASYRIDLRSYLK
jgi:hypothetical protein